MFSSLTVIFVVLQKYLVPLLFVIGLMYFIYGFIEYFIVGKGGDEGRAQHGRELFLKSITWFFLALVLHGVISLLGWLGNLSLSDMVRPETGGGAGGNIERGNSVLPVPDAPSRNDE